MRSVAVKLRRGQKKPNHLNVFFMSYSSQGCICCAKIQKNSLVLIYLDVMCSCEGKAEISATQRQSSVWNDHLEIILICWFS